MVVDSSKRSKSSYFAADEQWCPGFFKLWDPSFSSDIKPPYDVVPRSILDTGLAFVCLGFLAVVAGQKGHAQPDLTLYASPSTVHPLDRSRWHRQSCENLNFRPVLFRLPPTDHAGVASTDVAPVDEPISPNWWADHLVRPVLESKNKTSLSLDVLVTAALMHSQQIRIAKLSYFIEQEQITQEIATFDWNLFTEQLWVDTDEATGSQLVAGQGVNRLLQEDFSLGVGVRRRNESGGQLEATQNLRLHNSNSLFFFPSEQGLSRLTLRYKQPLLRDGGKLVNRGQIILAQHDSQATKSISEASINNVLLTTISKYWTLYRRRVEYLIQLELTKKTLDLLRQMKERSRIDAQISLLSQVRAELASRKADLGVAKTDLMRAQNELVRCVGHEELERYDEIMPSDVPAASARDWAREWHGQTAIQLGIQNRGELRAAMENIKKSKLSSQILRHQLLPRLAMIMETTASGISPDFKVNRALSDQFSAGAPSYSVGFSFDYPLGNRAASSRVRQAELNVAREVASFRDTVNQVKLDVKNATAALHGAHAEIDVRRDAVNKVNREIRAIQRRRALFPDESWQVSQLYLRELLDAQQRVATAERALVAAEVNFAISVVSLRQATGTLFRMERGVMLSD